MKPKVFYPLITAAVCLLSIVSNTLSAQVDLSNWEKVSLPPDMNNNLPNIIALTKGNDTYAAVGYAGLTKSLYTSTDGATWELSNAELPLTNAFPDDLVYIDGAFKMVTGGSIYASSNLIDWSFESVHLVFTARNFQKVNNLYFMGGEGNFATSVDGTTWINPMSGGDFLDLAYGNDMYVLVGRQFAQGILFTSSDGISWDTVFSVSDSLDMFYSVDFHDGRFILSGNDGIIGKSINGTDWTFSKPVGSGLTLFSIRHILNHWVISAGFRVFYSADGENWNESVIDAVVGNLKRIESYDDLGFIPGSQAQIIKTNATPTGVEANQLILNKLNVFPNPTSDLLMLTLNPEELAASNATFSIFDNQGKLISKQMVFEGNNQLNLNYLDIGTYTFQITGLKAGNQRGKFIKN